MRWRQFPSLPETDMVLLVLRWWKGKSLLTQGMEMKHRDQSTMYVTSRSASSEKQIISNRSANVLATSIWLARSGARCVFASANQANVISHG